jgi:hypothetical protein
MPAKTPDMVFPKNQTLMGGAYGALKLFETAPSGSTYRSYDPLGDPHFIVELIKPDIVSRDKKGQISPLPGKEKLWGFFSQAATKKIELLSRLNHPALQCIIQKFEEKGTHYVTFADEPQARALRSFSSANGFYDPSEITNIATTLIGLLDYIHAFGVYGFKIMPEAIALSDTDGMPQVLLRKYIDGSVEFELADATKAGDDCLVLAETLYGLLTGQDVPEPYFALRDQIDGYPDWLLRSIDQMLASSSDQGFANAAQWNAFLQQQNVAAQPLFSRIPKVWLWSGAAVFVAGIALGGLTMVGGSQSVDDGVSTVAQLDAQAADSNLSAPKPEISWRMDLPISVVQSPDGERLLMTLSDADAEFERRNPWFVSGDVLRAVDGVTVQNVADFPRLLSDSLETSENAIVALIVHDAVLPLEREVALIFDAVGVSQLGRVVMHQTSDLQGWKLQVAEISSGLNTSLNVGDEIMGFDSIAGFAEYLWGRQKSGETTATVRVKQRDGTMIDRTVSVAHFLND